MPLDPLAAFAIAAGLCAMAIGHILRMSSIEQRERESRRESKRTPQGQSSVLRLHSSGNARLTSVDSR